MVMSSGSIANNDCKLAACYVIKVLVMVMVTPGCGLPGARMMPIS